MNKKQYSAPYMETVDINTRVNLLSASGNLGNGNVPQADLDDVLPGSGFVADAPILREFGF